MEDGCKVCQRSLSRHFLNGASNGASLDVTKYGQAGLEFIAAKAYIVVPRYIEVNHLVIAM
ncbi:hypothetical protein PHLCEN_2v12232 [Hermanssonia centrifuga]|uniref:Uncharacterized protein n=1 Tax=Hermanssonia centrifuga TaxID=98765 RepID=A0A2R6NI07_9APHY|nr:hypothetical protein PHLCEN_2v12232 [Hermanssonia centrifuga]